MMTRHPIKLTHRLTLLSTHSIINNTYLPIHLLYITRYFYKHAAETEILTPFFVLFITPIHLPIHLLYVIRYFYKHAAETEILTPFFVLLITTIHLLITPIYIPIHLLYVIRYFYKHAAETEILERIEAAGGQGLDPESLTSQVPVVTKWLRIDITLCYPYCPPLPCFLSHQHCFLHQPSLSSLPSVPTFTI